MQEQNQTEQQVQEKNPSVTFKRVALAVVVPVVMTGTAFAADGDASGTTTIDYTNVVTGVAVVGGIISAGGLKALPTYVAWGVKKALSMLR